MESLFTRAQCLVQLLKNAGDPHQAELISDLRSVVGTLIEKTPPTEERNDICFAACAALAKQDIEFADKLYTDILEQRMTFGSDGSHVQKTFAQCLALVVRAIGAGCKAKVVTDEMISRLIAVIGKIPCEKRRIFLFNDMAVRAWSSDRIDLTRKIVEEHCKPLLADSKKIDEWTYRFMLVNSFASLYLAHAPSALGYLRDEQSIAKDYAIEQLCRVIRRKIPTQEPGVRDEFSAYPLSYNDCLDIIAVLEYMDYDNLIYCEIEAISENINYNRELLSLNR